MSLNRSGRRKYQTRLILSTVSKIKPRTYKISRSGLRRLLWKLYIRMPFLLRPTSRMIYVYRGPFLTHSWECCNNVHCKTHFIAEFTWCVGNYAACGGRVCNSVHCVCEEGFNYFEGIGCSGMALYHLSYLNGIKLKYCFNISLSACGVSRIKLHNFVTNKRSWILVIRCQCPLSRG